jgi:hypothetical protein
MTRRRWLLLCTNFASLFASARPNVNNCGSQISDRRRLSSVLSLSSSSSCCRRRQRCNSPLHRYGVSLHCHRRRRLVVVVVVGRGRRHCLDLRRCECTNNKLCGDGCPSDGMAPKKAQYELMLCCLGTPSSSLSSVVVVVRSSLSSSSSVGRRCRSQYCRRQLPLSSCAASVRLLLCSNELLIQIWRV